jgi:ribosomal protein S6--L-glutamate ligase
MKFLLLSTANPSKNLTEAIKKNGHTYEHHRPNDLYLCVSQSENGYDRIYDGSPELDKPQRLKAKDFDSVISRIGSSLDYGACILRHLTENIGIDCPQTADGLLNARDKMRTTQKLSSNGLKVPRTVMAKNPLHPEFLIEKIGGLPAVGKLLSGSQGKGVMILESALQTNTSLESFAKVEVDLLLQEYIEAGAKDIRAIVVGSKVVVAMERSGKKDFRANISQGGSGKKVELSESDQAICINAAKAVGLEFAGVDIIKDSTDTTYVIEVNGNPGEKIISITGVNYFEELVKFCESKTKQPNKPSQKQDVQEILRSWYNSGFQDGKNALPANAQRWTNTKEPIRENLVAWYEKGHLDGQTGNNCFEYWNTKN